MIFRWNKWWINASPNTKKLAKQIFCDRNSEHPMCKERENNNEDIQKK